MPSWCLSWDWGKLTRFGFCLGRILMMNTAKLPVAFLLVQKRVQPSCCSLHDVREDKDVLLPNTQPKTFRLLQVYKYSLIWQDWFSTLSFAKSIVRPKQVKLIFAHFLPYPRPLCSLLVIGDFLTFYAPLESVSASFFPFFFFFEYSEFRRLREPV